MVDSVVRLFPSNAKNFTSNGIGYLPDMVSCEVTEERNGSFELVMEYPVTGGRYDDITLRSILVAKPNPYTEPQAFRIYSVSKPFKGVVTYNAEHISYDISGYPVTPFSADTPIDSLQGLRRNCPVECPFTFWTNKGTIANFKIDVPNSMRSLLGGIEGSILDVYGGEYEFDNFTVKLHRARGENRGYTIRYGKNLTDLDQEENCANVYTGVYPYWYTEEDGLVESNPKIIQVEGTFDFDRILVLDCSQDYVEPPTPAQLKTLAESYIRNNNVGVPKVSLNISFVNLANSEEYKDLKILEEARLCDTMTVEFPKLGVKATAKCIQTVYNVITGKYTSLSLGDARTDLASAIVNNKVEIQNNLNDVNANIRTVITTESGFIRTEIENTDKKLSTAITQTDEYIRRDMRAEFERVDQEITDTNNELTETSTKLTNRITETAKEIRTELTETTETLTTTITTTKKNLEDTIDKTKNDLQDEIDTTNQTVVEKSEYFENKISETARGIRVELKEVNETLTTSITTTKKDLENTIDQTTDNLQNEIDITNKTIEERTEEFNNTIETTARGIRTELTEATNTLTATITKTKSDLQDEIDTTNQTVVETTEYFENKITETARGIRVDMNEVTKTLISDISTTRSTLEDTIENTKNGLQEEIDATNQTIVETQEEFSNTIEATARGIRTELSETSTTLTTTIEQTKNELTGEIETTREEIESAKEEFNTTIDATARGIEANVSKTYETKTDAEKQYDSLESSYSQLAGQIVLKVKSNGQIAKVALSADPSKGTTFTVGADNISLTADQVINLMSGGILNLGSKNITITSDNFSVDSKGNVICKSLSAVQFKGDAVNQLNQAIWDSETMKKINKIIEDYDKRIYTMESIVYSDKTLFDTLDALDTNWAWLRGTLQDEARPGVPAFISGNYMSMIPGVSLKPYTTIDATGFSKCIIRVRAEIEGQVTAPNINPYLAIRMGFTNDAEQAPVMAQKFGSDLHTGNAAGNWFNAIYDLTGFSDALKKALPLNVFKTNAADASGCRMYCSRITLTNN